MPGIWGGRSANTDTLIQENLLGRVEYMTSLYQMLFLWDLYFKWMLIIRDEEGAEFLLQIFR